MMKVKVQNTIPSFLKCLVDVPLSRTTPNTLWDRMLSWKEFEDFVKNDAKL